MLAYLSGFDFGAVVLVFLAVVAALHQGRKIIVEVRGVKATLGEVSHAVNGVDPGESKLIDKVRAIEGDVSTLKVQGRAAHIATVGLDATMSMHGERLQEIGRKADSAQRSARAAEVTAASSQQLISSYIAASAAAPTTPD